nr:MAG TPA: CI repressor [Caudoviricetes sp.]
MLDVRLIIERMKEVLGKENDKALSEELGVARTTFSNWKNRNNMPIDMILTFAQNYNLSLDWLIYGKENAPKLNEMETELLTRFNRLSFSEKLDIFNRLQGSTASAQSVGGDGFNVGGDFHVNQK